MAVKTPIRSGQTGDTRKIARAHTPTRNTNTGRTDTDKIEHVASLVSIGSSGGARRKAHQTPTEHERLARDLAELTHEGQLVATYIREGRFQRSLAVVAGMASLLGGLEVAYEHYRGSYSQRVMYSPPILSLVLAGVGVWAAFSRRVARTLLPLASLALLLDGVVGFIFHIRGIARKPGGWRIPVFNVIMGPPIFAPLLLGVSGLLGVIASLLRREDDPAAMNAASAPPVRGRWLRWLPRSARTELSAVEHEAREGRLQKWLAGATAVMALLNGVEALYSHYKNNFSYKVQWTPVLLSPLVIVAGIGAIWSKTIARTLLPITSLLALLNGAIGFFYHARGVKRRAGGLKHPIYNVLYGPPIFAPLLYAATGFLGVLASLLRRGD
ncbi:MAG: hypothetical protein ABI068_12525 [Ktedonobacterales bacterium]